MTQELDTRERLLDAAGPVFAEKGFQDATIRDICRCAGVNVASVNYHFGDKERLYIETVKRARLLRERQFPLPSFQESSTPAERLYAFVETLLRRMLETESPWQSRLMMREMLEPTAACRELVEEFFRPEFEILLEIVGDLLGRETPMHDRRQFAFGVIGQCMVHRVAGHVVEMLTPPREYARYHRIGELARRITYLCLAASGHQPPLGNQGLCPSSEETESHTQV